MHIEVQRNQFCFPAPLAGWWEDYM